MRRTSLAVIGSAVLTAVVTATPAHAAGGPEQTRISAQLSTSKISIGQHATVSGKLEADGASGWQPLANQPVDIYLRGAALPSPVEVTTDAQGDYTYQIGTAPGSIGQATVTAYFNIQGNPNPAYTSASSPSLALSVPVTRSFAGGEIQSSAYGMMMLAGHFDPALKPGSPVAIQYSADGNTKWTTMVVARADKDGWYSGTAYSLHSGYWRAYYQGDVDDYPIAAENYRNWRWNTHFTSFKASRSGSRVSTSGTLVRYYSPTRQGGFAHQPVEILFRFRGTKKWYLVGTAQTNTKGQFATRVKRYGAGSYLALFQGTDDTWAAASPTPIYVRSSTTDGATALDGPLPTDLPQPSDHIQHLP